MAKKKYFQDHGDHIQTVMTTEEFMMDVLPTIGDWIPVASSKKPMPTKPKTDMIALQKGEADVAFLGLIAVTPKRNMFMSAYPVAKGNIVDMTINDIYEWKEPYEAYIWATIGEDLEVCFFATDYFCNKEKYVKGATLQVDMAAMGVEIQPGHEDITLDPEEAMKFYEHMEGGAEKDENGDVMPLVLSCSELVGLLPASDECPDIQEFHSPVRSFEKITIEGKEFAKVGIVISHEPDDIEIPLYFNLSQCNEIEGSGNVMGILWLQAHLPNAFVPYKVGD